jgi:hypothetical protein
MVRTEEAPFSWTSVGCVSMLLSSRQTERLFVPLDVLVGFLRPLLEANAACSLLALKGYARFRKL